MQKLKDCKLIIGKITLQTINTKPLKIGIFLTIQTFLRTGYEV